MNCSLLLKLFWFGIGHPEISKTEVFYLVFEAKLYTCLLGFS